MWHPNLGIVFVIFPRITLHVVYFWAILFNIIQYEIPESCVEQTKRIKNVEKKSSTFQNASNYTSFHMLLSTWICILNNIKLIWMFSVDRSCSCSCMNRVILCLPFVTYIGKWRRSLFFFFCVNHLCEAYYCLRRNFYR